MPDVVEPLAFVLEEAGTRYGILLPGQLLGKPGKRIGLAFILHRLLTAYGAGDALIVCIGDRRAYGDLTHGEREV